MEIKDLDLLSPRKAYLSYAGKTPCFLFEPRILKNKARIYLRAVKKSAFSVRPFYAIKSNCYSPLLAELVRLGFGMDASSSRELRLAHRARAKDVIYTGPGKTAADLTFALKEFRDPVIHLDSFQDLRNLEAIRRSRPVRICVRINTKSHGGWKKFGIPLGDLRRFYLAAKKMGKVDFSGIHFHNSWNKGSEPYIKTLNAAARYFKHNFTAAECRDFRIIDIGGGLYTDCTEGDLKKRKGRSADLAGRLSGYTLIRSQDINKVVSDLDRYLKNSLFGTIDGLTIFTEPGRWLSTHCFQILLKAIDIKNERLVILDGGTENFGYTVKDAYYFPVYNLTHPGKREKKITLAGSLCSIDDIWGYYCYTSKIEAGDIMLLPFQGAYTYSYAKDFIRPFPPVYHLGKNQQNLT